MEKLKKNKKKLILIILIILVLSLALTYAWFVWKDTGKNTIKIKGGSLSLKLDDGEEEVIKVTNAIPQSDNQGIKNDAYTFSVINTGTMNAKYTLSLEDVELSSKDGENKRMSDSNIRYSLTRNNSPENPTTLSSRVLEENTIIDSGKTYTYTLKFWIQSEATTKIAEEVFKVRLKLDAIQTDESGIKEINQNIKAVYRYNQDGSGYGTAYTGCLGGSESGCSNIVSTLNGESEYNKGDIVKYEVSDGIEKYFNVIHDDGSTLTMQQRENTINNMPWYGVSGNITNENGPSITEGYALYELEKVTSNWTNVNDISYSIGDDTTTLGYSGCFSSNNCNTKKYGNMNRTAKARMITLQELDAIPSDSRKFINNYLKESTRYGTSFESDNAYYYWTMTAAAGNTNQAFYVDWIGRFLTNGVNASNGVRAVVVIDK